MNDQQPATKRATPAIEKATDIIANAPFGSGRIYLKRRDALRIAEALDAAGVLKQRLR